MLKLKRSILSIELRTRFLLAKVFMITNKSNWQIVTILRETKDWLSLLNFRILRPIARRMPEARKLEKHNRHAS